MRRNRKRKEELKRKAPTRDDVPVMWQCNPFFSLKFVFPLFLLLFWFQVLTLLVLG